jgi:beta-phosphoglucomutase-like phosphatase (HAD superfamily)
VDEQLRAQVDAAVAEVEKRCAADSELVPGDVVEEVALERDLDVAVLMCQEQMGFVPDTIRARIFESEHSASYAKAAERRVEREATEAKARQRSQRAAATRASTAVAEAVAASEQIRSKTCPVCFTVRSPSGSCACE